MNRVALFLCLFTFSAAHAVTLPEETPYAVEITDVTDVRPLGEGDAINATLVLSDPIPNSGASVIFRGAGNSGSDVIHNVLPGGDLPEGRMTQRIDVQFNPRKLGMSAASLRGKMLQQNSFRYDLAIVEVRNRRPVTGRPFDNAELVFSRPVPNGHATIVAEVGGQAVRKILWPANVRKGAATRTLSIQAPTAFLDALVGSSVRVYSPGLPVRN